MKNVFKIDEAELVEKLRALRSANDEKPVPADAYETGKQSGYFNGLSDAIFAVIELISSQKTIMIEEEE